MTTKTARQAARAYSDARDARIKHLERAMVARFQIEMVNGFTVLTIPRMVIKTAAELRALSHGLERRRNAAQRAWHDRFPDTIETRRLWDEAREEEHQRGLADRRARRKSGATRRAKQPKLRLAYSSDAPAASNERRGSLSVVPA
jgi:hypothetical protein